MPRLLIKPYGYLKGDVCELEQAKYLDYKAIVLIDGRRMNSFEEIEYLAAQDEYKNRELIEVVLLPAVAGG